MPKRARCPHCDRLFDRRLLDNHTIRCKSRSSTRMKISETPIKSTVIVDGNNIAYHLSHDNIPRVENILNAVRSLSAAGYTPIIVVSAALKHKINKPEVLQDIENLVEAKSGTNDDLLIIHESQKRNADIVSNDRFLNWQTRYPWVSSRLRRYRLTTSGLILS